jgi:hypothetical protein
MVEDGMMTVSLLMSQALLLTAVAGLIFAMHRMRKQEKRYNAALRSLQDDFAALCNGAVGVGDHLYHVEQNLRRLSQRQDQVDLHDPTQQSFDHAVRLVENGASIEDVMSQCGLVRSEAELLAMLHRRGKTAS